MKKTGIIEKLKALESQGLTGIGEITPLVSRGATESVSGPWGTVEEVKKKVLDRFPGWSEEEEDGSDESFKSWLGNELENQHEFGFDDRENCDSEEDLLDNLGMYHEYFSDKMSKEFESLDEICEWYKMMAWLYESIGGRDWEKETGEAEEAMSTTGLETLQTALANLLKKYGSVQVIDTILNTGLDLGFDFEDQVTFIKNTTDLSNTNKVLNEILSQAELLLDDIQLELLADRLGKEVEEEVIPEENFDDYREPEDWDSVDEEETQEDEEEDY